MFNTILNNSKERIIFTAFAGSLLLFILGMATNFYLLWLVPIALAFIVSLVYDYSFSYYLFFLVIPFSVEYYTPIGIGTDIPSEPLMILCTGTTFFTFITNLDKVTWKKYLNPITILLLFHLIWVLIAALLSDAPLISIKWFLAKVWYVVPFYFFSLHFLMDIKKVKKILSFSMWGLYAAVIFVLIRHSLFDFSFDSANHVCTPIFRNHVTYAATVVLFIPFIWAFYKWTESKRMKGIYLMMMAVFTIGVYFSYTRAAILCLIIAVIAHWVIKWKMMGRAIVIALLGLTFLITFLYKNDNYLKFAPNFETTVSHTEFSNLLDATYKLEDISTMERVYRWVAGANMIQQKPIIGFGPGSFYTFYQTFTVTSFRTYVSNNPEKSGIHNYYLMTMVEQGVIGFVILMLMCIGTLIVGQRVYHNTKDNDEKILVMAANLCLVIIMVINLINDTLEVDKIGSFFFLCMALIARQWYINRLPMKS
jgi:O-antigen ligase